MTDPINRFAWSVPVRTRPAAGDGVIPDAWGVPVRLGCAAGTAIGDARLDREQRRWLDASFELTQVLFGWTDELPLDALLRFALRAAAADRATFTAALTERTARVEAVAGAQPGRPGDIVSRDRTLVGRVIRSGQPVLTHDAAFDTDDLDDPAGGTGAVIGVPVPGPAGAVRGVLVVAHPLNRAWFTMSDRDRLARFAGHAGIALELDRARGERESLRRLEDHERIAADLHDHVIEELFATGMGLQSLLSQLTRPDQRIRVGGFIDSLDGTIRGIRNAIYQLHAGREALPALRKRLLAVLTEQTTHTDLTARIEFAGPLDELPDSLPEDTIAVLREALSNTVRHAQASTVDVKVTTADRVLTVEVTDNGVGIGRPGSTSGLANLRRRAETHGGTLHHHTPPGGGTHLAWTANTAIQPTVTHPPAAGTSPPG